MTVEREGRFGSCQLDVLRGTHDCGHAYMKSNIMVLLGEKKTALIVCPCTPGTQIVFKNTVHFAAVAQCNWPVN